MTHCSSRSVSAPISTQTYLRGENRCETFLSLLFFFHFHSNSESLCQVSPSFSAQFLAVAFSLPLGLKNQLKYVTRIEHLTHFLINPFYCLYKLIDPLVNAKVSFITCMLNQSLLWWQTLHFVLRFGFSFCSCGLVFLSYPNVWI